MAHSDDDLPATVPPSSRPTHEGDANLDPLTHEPGAHPVGVGVGAAGAGAVGALIGAVAGPVGILVGTVFGALAGAAVGKEAAEKVHPTDPALRHEAEEAAEALPAEAGLLAVPSGANAPGEVTMIPIRESVVTDDATPEPPTARRLQRIVLARPATPVGTPAPLEVTVQTAYPEDHVREAAYFRYLERRRNGEPGGELDDWTAAEREVLRG